MRILIILAGVFGFLGVAAGAFGAHALKKTLSPDMLAVFETGARYQVYHALALLAVSILGTLYPSKLFKTAGWLFTAGILVFSGTLYTLSLTGVKWLGAITPLGGACFLAGWLCLAIAGWGIQTSRPVNQEASRDVL